MNGKTSTKFSTGPFSLGEIQDNDFGRGREFLRAKALPSGVLSLISVGQNVHVDWENGQGWGIWQLILVLLYTDMQHSGVLTSATTREAWGSHGKSDELFWNTCQKNSNYLLQMPATGLHVPEPVVSDERVNTAVGEGVIYFHLNWSQSYCTQKPRLRFYNFRCGMPSQNSAMWLQWQIKFYDKDKKKREIFVNWSILIRMQIAWFWLC